MIAAVIRVLDACRIRIGNRAYARANKSFGATPLRRRHMTITRGRTSYIRPNVLDAASSGELPAAARPTKWLDRGETALLALQDK